MVPTITIADLRKTTLVIKSPQISIAIVVTELTTRPCKCNFCSKKGHIATACLFKKRKWKIGNIKAKKTGVVISLHTR